MMRASIVAAGLFALPAAVSDLAGPDPIAIEDPQCPHIGE
jgi:hypothetical protein